MLKTTGIDVQAMRLGPIEPMDYHKAYLKSCDDNARLRAELITQANDLRDKFSMAALTGYMAVPDDRTYNPNRDDCAGLTVEVWQAKMAKQDAEYCYLVADAMMKARETP